jgi:hypothetical protein
MMSVESESVSNHRMVKYVEWPPFRIQRINSWLCGFALKPASGKFF